MPTAPNRPRNVSASRLPRVACASVLLAALMLVACLQPRPAPSVIILGIDGMDPTFVERHWDALPNLAALRRDGAFARLATTTPPQSPVAWSTFITGLAPADHEIFDFVHRDAKTLQPFSSMAGVAPPGHSLPLGPYLLPLSGSHIQSLRQGTPFWSPLATQDWPVTIWRMPTEYPPSPFGHAISGMGTPDLIGSLGTFTLFTDAPSETSRLVSGGRIVKIIPDRGHTELPLEGPPNTLRKDARPTATLLSIDVDSVQPLARIQAGGEVVVLTEGEWSNWLPVSFDLIPHVASVSGAVRVFAKQLHPGLELYVTPINVDPLQPALPIAQPPSWAAEVAHEIGRFSTLGIPEDTASLRQGVFDLPQFLNHARLVFAEEQRLLRYALRHHRGGLLFFYFSSIDQSSHILWGRHEHELLATYREVDAAIGEVRSAFPAAKLLILSDHGFAAFDRAVNVNTWLQHHGFLALRAAQSNDTGLESIDWPHSAAYAVGLNALYINQQGREKEGTVPSGSPREALLETLRGQLLSWRDPVSNRLVISSVTRVRHTPHNAGVAPDLILGFAPGYRASWQTGLGGTPIDELEDNNDAWIGDHCMNAADVPGVFFSNWKMSHPPEDIAGVTALVRELTAPSQRP